MLIQTLKAALRLCVCVQVCVCVCLSLFLCMCVCKCVCKCVCVCVCGWHPIFYANPNPWGDLRQGWVWFEPNFIFRVEFQFTKRLIIFVCVETNQMVGSNPNVILTQQTCGQRSNRAAESKRRALALYFSMRICCRFVMSKHRGDWDGGLCMTWGLARRMPLCSGDISWLVKR